MDLNFSSPTRVKIEIQVSTSDISIPLIHSPRKFNYLLLEKHHYSQHEVYEQMDLVS